MLWWVGTGGNLMLGGQMNRRAFIAALGGAAAWPLTARGQQPIGGPRIGMLWPGLSAPPWPRMESFDQGLRESGFVQGQSVLIDLRYGPGDLQHLSELAAELVRLKPDVIVALGDLAPRAVQKTTETIPIVALSDDLVGAGLITSLSRPGGNTTGITILSPELSAKRLEVLSELLPGLSRVAAIWDPTTGASQVGMSENAARALKIRLLVLEVERREDLAGAFRAAKQERAEAVNVFASPFLSSISQEILNAAAESRLPAIYQWREHAEAGGLVSYGPRLADLWRQTAIVVGKILKGAKPANMPVEQPTKFEFVVNLKTAKVLGIGVPTSLLLRADEVIE
jgi:putative ABC transport system substrate-binding protein